MGQPVKLDKISSQSFEHPADRAALEALQRTVGFKRLMRLLAKHGLDKIGRIINESSNLRLSERQLPSLHALHREVCATLDVEPPPLYLMNSPVTNAFTSGVDAPFVVVTSALVDGFDDEEIACVLGHEVGHIMAGHVLYGMIARSLHLILASLGNLTPFGWVIEVSLLSTLLYWQRCAELTADRAGLLAVQDPQISMRTDMKLSAGPETRFAKELDLEAFMQQAREFEEEEVGAVEGALRSLLEGGMTHPWPVIRAREIDRWVRSGAYQRILGGEYQRRARSLLAQHERPDPGDDATEVLASEAEGAITIALGRSYGVHLAPRIPEEPLHLALGTYADSLEANERVVALYDLTMTGAGDRGVLLTDRRLCASSRPRQGVPYRDLARIRRTGGGLFSGPGLEVEGLELRFHTRAVRDAFVDALVGAATAFRGGQAPQVE